MKKIITILGSSKWTIFIAKFQINLYILRNFIEHTGKCFLACVTSSTSTTNENTSNGEDNISDSNDLNFIIDVILQMITALAAMFLTMNPTFPLLTERLTPPGTPTKSIKFYRAFP